MRKVRRRWGISKVALAGAVILLGAWSGTVSASGAAAASPHRGGSLTYLVADGQWPGLDPATNPQDTADSTEQNAIYGQLFEVASNGKIVPSEATGYRFLNGGLTVEIFIRPGQTFQDGTPFTAAAVASSIRRDLVPSNGCLCLPNFKDVTSVTASGPTTVVIRLSTPFYPLIEAFIDAAPNWTVSPTALQRMGEAAFAQHPVGAGPFEVVSNQPNTKLVLKRNPHYWQKGQPYLDNLTFVSTGSDESDYAALVTGEAQMTEFTTTQVVKKALTTPSLTVHALPPVSYEFVALNEKTAPLNNILAREALMYATNTKAIVKALYQNLYTPVEAPTAAGDLFYEPKVPGARTYDLSKAKALVKRLGGLTVTLGTTTNTAQQSTEASALASEWSQAGIKVTIDVTSLEQMLEDVKSNHWQAIVAQWGNNGPDPGDNLPFYFASYGILSGTHDPTLDTMLAKAAAEQSMAQRAASYRRIYARMNEMAESVFEYSKYTYVVTRSNVEGISNNIPQINWESISLK